METTLPLPLIPFVDIAKGPEDSNGLTRQQLAFLGCVHFVAKNDDIDRLLQFLQRHVSIETQVDVTDITSIEEIVAVLDAGARKVFVNPSQLPELQKYGDRVLPAIDAQDEKLSSQPAVGGLLIKAGEDVPACTAILKRCQASKISPVFLAIDRSNNINDLVDVARVYNAIPIIPSVSLTVEQVPSANKVSVPAFIDASWSSDRTDKLIPTVVTDERGIALGLVYSSKESLAESLKTGTGVYQSRKRGLWYKGATSGDVQELVKIALDCDQDCMKFVVRQKGRGKDIFLSRLHNFTNTSRFLPPPTIIMLW
jgi:phosphoribosyl-ATP pyrophosphohydrolase/phosphoribosyl-AMP cyclohydrolase/histidinol dehydrogenase